MSRKFELPDEVAAVLGDDPEGEVLEALLLHLIRTDRVSVAWAGERLGLGRREAIRWYTSRGHPFPDYAKEDLEEDVRYVRRRATGHEVTSYYDPETGEVRSDAPDFFGNGGGEREEEGP